MKLSDLINYDKIYNYLLNVGNWACFHLLRMDSGRYFVPDYYRIRTFENYAKMKLEEFDAKYHRSQAWGDYHPNDLQQWYDPTGVTLDEEGLKLHVTQNTKTVTSYAVDKVLKHDQPPVVIPYGVGLCASRDGFGYGIYEWNIKLPEGAGLWPAIWVSNKFSWPPEIDVLEAYSNKDGKYGTTGRALETNIHCGSMGDNHYNLGAGSHGSYIPKGQTLNLICHWTDEFIKIYYNGFMVRIITREKDIKWFRNASMINVMNTALRKHEIVGMPFEKMSVAPMIVYDFTHYTI